MNYDIDFLEYEKLYSICDSIIKKLQKSVILKDTTLHSNIVDPFSAIFDASINNVSLEKWLKIEKIRQIQKTFQNQIGSFHQKILGNIKGWQELAFGGVVDVVNNDRKILAEIKNKFNTTKGNHKIAIYDDLDNLLRNKYKNYTAYYVTILTKKEVNRPFTPSDNRTNTRRPVNNSIIEISGKNFYKIATGDNQALFKIYKVLPYIIADILKSNHSNIVSDPLFDELFIRAFH